MEASNQKVLQFPWFFCF